jgi:prepilin-type N-terminal cleavage/methylation domain-containing protein
MTTEIIPTETTKKRDKGFTLVELLIVVAILGVLATITVLSVRGINNNSKASVCAADKKTYAVAFEAYMAQFSPPTGQQFIAVTPAVGGVNPPAGVIAGATAEVTLVNAKLLKEVSNNVDISTAGAVSNQSGGNC